MPRVYEHRDLTGLRFGKLLVLGETDRKLTKQGDKPVRFQVAWSCRCDCGKEIVVLSGSLVGRRALSCGCRREENRLKVITKSPRKVAVTCQYLKYKGNAKERGHLFCLTKEDIENIIFLPCIYCGSDPANKVTNSKGNFVSFVSGIDRLNSKLGYEKTNVVPCCWVCNKAKGSSTYEEFMGWIKKLTQFNSQKDLA